MILTIWRFKALKIYNNTSNEEKSNKIQGEIDILKNQDNKYILKYLDFFFIEFIEKKNLSTLKQYYLVTPYYEVLFFKTKFEYLYINRLFIRKL